MRFILLIFFIILIFWIFYPFFKPISKSKKKCIKSKKMVSCQYCKTYIPENEAINKGTGFYCSLAHFVADQKEK